MDLLVCCPGGCDGSRIFLGRPSHSLAVSFEDLEGSVWIIPDLVVL